MKKGPDHVPPGASTTGFEPPGAGCEQKCTTMRRPTKKGPAPNRGAKEDDVRFPKSRGRGGELRDPVPADLFKLYSIRQHRRIVATKKAPRGEGGA